MRSTEDISTPRSKALEVTANFFGNALEKNAPEPFFCLNAYRYGFQGQEKDDEIKGAGNSVNYTYRMHDPRLGRFFTVDPLAAEFPHNSPYAFSENRVIDAIELEGKEAYLLTWFSKDGETGHAGIAVTNYKYVEKTVTIQGQEMMIKVPVPDGTVTYYDLWPKSPVGRTELQSGVTPDYNGRTVNLSDLTTKDVSASGEAGSVSQFGERRPADGVIQIDNAGQFFTQFQFDLNVKMDANALINQGDPYNACTNNCSNFSQNVLSGTFPGLDASQEVNVSGGLSLIYDDASVVAPNNLYNAVSNMSNSTVIKGPEKVEAKPYLEYYGK